MTRETLTGMLVGGLRFDGSSVEVREELEVTKVEGGYEVSSYGGMQFPTMERTVEWLWETYWTEES